MENGQAHEPEICIFNVRIFTARLRKLHEGDQSRLVHQHVPTYKTHEIDGESKIVRDNIWTTVFKQMRRKDGRVGDNYMPLGTEKGSGI